MKKNLYWDSNNPIPSIKLDDPQYYKLFSAMNLFYLDYDIKKCAEYHVNRHCGKMILEAAQVLCAAFHLQDINAPYKLSHKNHPTCRWVRESKENFEWTLSYAGALGIENHYRTGNWHKSLTVVAWAQANKHLLSFQQSGITPFALAMPDEYKTSDPVESYRNYYREAKKHLHSWKNRDQPYWL